MKLRVPRGCAAVSHNGGSLSIMEDGSVEIDDVSLELLVPHGFLLWQSDAVEVQQASDALSLVAEAGASIAPASDDIERLNRSGLFAFLKANGVSVSLPITNQQLRSAARRALER